MKILSLIGLFINPILIIGFSFLGWQMTEITKWLLVILLLNLWISDLKSILTT